MSDTYRSPLLDLHGAVEADPPDAGVAAHYGSIAGEQRRLEAGEGFVDLSHRDVVSISGPDRLTWLHALTTQHVEHLPPGEPTDAAPAVAAGPHRARRSPASTTARRSWPTPSPVPAPRWSSSSTACAS